MENKQTAVEWLEEKINLYDFQVGMASMRKYIEYAKEMEKEQIKDSFVECYKANVPDVFECKLDAEQYYEETYGK
jgi:hypothetical protein